MNTPAPTSPPAEADDSVRDFEHAIKALGESDARLEHLRRLLEEQPSQ